MMTERTFEDVPAIRRSVPIHIGIVGPSGSGKTFSALRLATGIQEVYGGELFHIDTEASRALHYADRFRFRHVPFCAPFDPLSYLAAVKHCVNKGAKTIILDSASHLHEGQGGTLESHEAECDRLCAAWRATRDKVQMAAWAKPKAELRRFINEVLQMNVNVIWCYRAKEKVKLINGKTPQAQGFMPISSDELIYEMSCNMLLYPNSGGIPSWHSEEMGERAIIKNPVQFRDIFKESKPLDEMTGRKLAEWGCGGSNVEQSKAKQVENQVEAVSAIFNPPENIQTITDKLIKLIIANEDVIPPTWQNAARDKMNDPQVTVAELEKVYNSIMEKVK
jgi:ABC-type oligopeptide transport system ATPase subunit